jgi:hypothetical protein
MTGTPDDWLLEHYDDGSTVHLAAYSGGADATGAWGRLWLRFVAADGSETRCEYRVQHAMADFDQRLKKLDQVVDVQSRSGNWNYDAYMLGMANGLILATAILHDREPVYLEQPEKWLADLR